MTPAESDAFELVNEVERDHPHAVLLAQVVSIAARIEPELLRQARLKLLPREADAGTEADLWFSPLVQSATPVALVLLPEVAGLLRQRLSQSGRLLERSWDLLRRVHKDAPLAIKLEEEVTWRALSGDAGAQQWIERELMSVVSAIVNQGRTGLARWALRALPRLPDAARRTRGATMLALASAARLGSWQLFAEQAQGKNLRPGTLSRLRVVLPPDLPQAAVGVRLFESEDGAGAGGRAAGRARLGVEFTHPPPPDAASDIIEVPATDPLLLEVSWAEGPRRTVKHVSLYQGRAETIEVGGPSVTVRTARGDAYTIRRATTRRARRVSGAGRAEPPTAIPPPPVVGFVGRLDAQGRDLVERLKVELWPGRGRVLALWGPGGIGKTTLAAEAARSQREAYENRVVWSSADGRADFSLLTLLDDIATQLGRADLRRLSPAEKERQTRALAAEALVVLDNYETIAAAEQRRIERWLSRTKCSALLTTRKRPTGRVLVLVPAVVGAMSPKEGMEFLSRLRQRASHPRLFTREVLGEIYDVAEGNPYLMQWAAAQVDFAREPVTVLHELSEGKGDAAERLFERTFNLPKLGEDGRSALLALSLFTPSASREALAEVSGLSGDRKRLIQIAGNLSALGLVKQTAEGARLSVEGLARDIVRARPEWAKVGDELRRRFVAYFSLYAIERKKPTPENYDALEGEFDNLMSAIETAFALKDWEDAVTLCNAVGDFLDTRGYWDEALRRSGQGRRAAEKAKMPEPLPTEFAEVAANIHLRRGEYARAKRGFTSVLARYRSFSHHAGVERSLRRLGTIAVEQNDLTAARQYYNESLKLSHTLKDPKGIADNLHNLAVVLQAGGELAGARGLYEEALAYSQKLGDQQSIATTLHQLGVVAAEMGDMAEARRFYQQSLAINQKLGAQEAVGSTLHQLGRLEEMTRNLTKAKRDYADAIDIFGTLRSPSLAEAESDFIRIAADTDAPPQPKSPSKLAPAKKAAKKAAKKSSKASKASGVKGSSSKKRGGATPSRGSKGALRGGMSPSRKGSARNRMGGQRFVGRSGRRTK